MAATVLYSMFCIILVGIASVTAKTPIFGLQQFLIDTIDHFGYTSSVFVTRGDLCCCPEMASVVPSVYLCYEDDNYATDVLKTMQKLYDLNELKIIFFFGNGLEELLKMRSDNFDLLNSGVPLVMSHVPDTSSIRGGIHQI
jgi:hypothetical protein